MSTQWNAKCNICNQNAYIESHSVSSYSLSELHPFIFEHMSKCSNPVISVVNEYSPVFDVWATQ